MASYGSSYPTDPPPVQFVYPNTFNNRVQAYIAKQDIIKKEADVRSLVETIVGRESSRLGYGKAWIA